MNLKPHLGNRTLRALCLMVLACGIATPMPPAQSQAQSQAVQNLIPLKDGKVTSGQWRVLVIPVEFHNWKHDKPMGSPDNPFIAPQSIQTLEALVKNQASSLTHSLTHSQQVHSCL